MLPRAPYSPDVSPPGQWLDREVNKTYLSDVLLLKTNALSVLILLFGLISDCIKLHSGWTRNWLWIWRWIWWGILLPTTTPTPAPILLWTLLWINFNENKYTSSNGLSKNKPFKRRKFSRNLKISHSLFIYEYYYNKIANNPCLSKKVFLKKYF